MVTKGITRKTCIRCGVHRTHYRSEQMCTVCESEEAAYVQAFIEQEREAAELGKEAAD